mgnify:CR=1 FL=1
MSAAIGAGGGTGANTAIMEDYAALDDLVARIEKDKLVKNYRKLFTKFRQVFRASKLVKYLYTWQLASNEPQACVLGQRLCDSSLIAPHTEEAQHVFKRSKAFYRLIHQAEVLEQNEVSKG